MEIIARYYPTKKLSIPFQLPHNKAGQVTLKVTGTDHIVKHPVNSLDEAKEVCDQYHSLYGAKPILTTIVDPAVSAPSDRLLDDKGMISRSRPQSVKVGSRRVSID